MRRRVTRAVAVLGLLVAVAVAVRIVASAVNDNLDAADEVVVSSRPGDLVEGDADEDGGDDPLPKDASETPEQATLVTRTVVSKGDDEDDGDDGDGDGDTPPPKGDRTDAEGDRGEAVSQTAADSDQPALNGGDPGQGNNEDELAGEEAAQQRSVPVLDDGIDTPTPTDNDGTDSDGIDTPTPVTDGIDTPTPSPLTPVTDGIDTPTPSPLTPVTDGIDTPTPSPPTPSPLTPVTDGIDTPTPSPLTPSPLTPETPATPVSDLSDPSDVSTVSNNDGGNADGVATHQLARTANPSARTKRRRRSMRGKPPLLEAVDFPADPALPQLERLFDPGWVWDASVCRFPEATDDPCRLRIRQFSHLPGRFATVNYEAQWAEEAFLAPEFFTVTLRRGNTAAVSRFPHDDALPGLAPAVGPDSALRLVDQHVFAVPRRLMAVETVRYRPANRAVLRHQTGKFSFFARVVRPTALPSLLAAAELIDASRFVSAPVVGCWADGGVVWVPEVPGVNLRDSLASGHAPDPALLLDGLHSLWALPPSRTSAPAFDLVGAYRRAERTFAHVLRDDTDGRRLLREVTEALAGFVDDWQPTTIAHNDFYDDQMICMPDGRIALVDFEEAGPGDPMLDVGNLLAHLRWALHGTSHDPADARAVFYDQTKHAALERFGWNAHELALREAVCIFRICTNTVRRIKPDWQQRTRDGLALAANTLA